MNKKWPLSIPGRDMPTVEEEEGEKDEEARDGDDR